MLEYITIQGVQVHYTRATIPVAKCRLDPNNPRIQYILGQKNTLVTENELDRILWKKESVKALSQAIMQNGGVRDPIIVQATAEGGYVVREGNCRVTSCNHLVAEYPNDSRFNQIPAMIFTDTLSDEHLAILLVEMHVTGKIEWEAYEKAKKVHDLHTKYGKPYEWLSMSMRLSKSKIYQLLTSYQQMDEYLKKYPTESIRKFSRFSEAIKKKVIREKLEKDDKFKETFYRWLKEDKLTDNHHIRELPRILENPSALDALDKGGFDAAYSIILKSDPALESYLFSSIKNAIENLEGASMVEIQELRNDAKKVSMLQALYHATQNLAAISQVALT